MIFTVCVVYADGIYLNSNFESNKKIYKMELTIIDPKQFGIEENEAVKLTNGLDTILAEREILKDAYLDVMTLEVTPENQPIFKELRLKIVKNRTQGIEKWHKENKAFFLAGGRFVDAIKNKEVAVNEDWESKLMEVEKHFENLEKERLATLKADRWAKLQPFTEVEPFGLDLMDDVTFDNLLNGAKISHEQKVAESKRIEDERIAAEKAEAERIRLQEIENAKLKAEAEKREKEIEAERKRVEAEREKERKEAEAKQKAIEDAARIEREKAEAIAKAEAEKTAKLEAELKAEKDRQAKIEADKLAEIERQRKEAEKLAKAPIKKQLASWIETFTYGLAPVQNETSKEIEAKFNSFKDWAKKQVEAL